MQTNRAKQILDWLSSRKSQAIDRAYKAACDLIALEQKYLEGNKIAKGANPSQVVSEYLERLRDRALLEIRLNLVQVNSIGFVSGDPLSDSALEKLGFVENTIAKYRPAPEDTSKPELSEAVEPESDNTPSLDLAVLAANAAEPAVKGLSRRGQSETEYEEQVVLSLRYRRKQNRATIRFFAILLIVPLIVQVAAKNLIFEPLLGNYSNRYPDRIELNNEIEKRFDTEFNFYKDRLEIQNLLGLIPELTEETRREKLEEAATEMWRDAREEELTGIKNILADSVALVAFAVIVAFNRRRLRMMRTSVHRSFMGLNEPIRIFLLIFISDTFVGYHSAEGWDVILDTASEHFGITLTKSFVGIFIATVPVFMDACLKFWIFSYLTSYSPSSSAIYERMNT